MSLKVKLTLCTLFSRVYVMVETWAVQYSVVHTLSSFGLGISYVIFPSRLCQPVERVLISQTLKHAFHHLSVLGCSQWAGLYM